ncbi:MAG: response regulator [Thermoleophilia bacterium]|nr:response regulator [Thermoleophilia bacterium]MDH3725681.1 response regulator [Thermoleophilia bacterium]
MTEPVIAVVEDNPDNRLLIQAMLGGRFRLVEFEDGSSALAAMRAEPPALVLLDISLPGMSGVEVLEHMRADPALAQLPVVAVTAHAMAGDRERYLDLGFDAYISKPIVDVAQLTATIERCLGAAPRPQ